MSMRGVLRLGEVQIRVMDTEAAKTHYGTRMGLIEMDSNDNGLVYYKAWDEKDHHSVVLRLADKPGLDHLAFKVYDDATLTSLAEKIEAFGLSVEEVPAGAFFKSGRRIRFTLPTGHEMHLYAEKEYVGNSLGEVNPGVIPDEGVNRGFRINGLDHCFIAGPNAREAIRLFTDVFEFDLTEQVVDENQAPQIMFVSCSTRAHDIAIAEAPEPALFHHASFRLDSTQDHVHAADLIGKYDIPVEMIDRHGVTRVKTIYYFDPSGNRNEIFCDGYTWYPDHPTLTWTMDNIGGAAFSQSRQVPESFFGSMT
ncbi:catechol 2,3-dioxygenase [Marinobacter nauticus]|uniref:Catechol 2,3-dioxygenase n=2 Tax=Marinobacter nauticus TaxID=2743 RepID=A0A1M2URV0_MARNT|nr:catechol 2,3-dioxygenase [Marinobacter nauticus]